MKLSTTMGFQGFPAYVFAEMNFVSEDAGISWLANENCWKTKALPDEVASLIHPVSGDDAHGFLSARFYRPGKVWDERDRLLSPSMNKSRVNSVFPLVEGYPERYQMIVLGIILALMGDGYDFDAGLLRAWEDHLPEAFCLLVAGVPPLSVSAFIDNKVDFEILSSVITG